MQIGAPPGGTPPALLGGTGTNGTRSRAQNVESACPERESIRFKSPLGPNRMWLVTRANSSEAELLFPWRGTRGAHAVRVGVLMPPVRVGVVGAVEPAPHGLLQMRDDAPARFAGAGSAVRLRCVLSGLHSASRARRLVHLDTLAVMVVH